MTPLHSVVVAALVAATAFPMPAGASLLTLTPPPDPVAEVAQPWTISGSAAEPSILDAGIELAAEGCHSTPGVQLAHDVLVPAGPFVRTAPMTADAAGDWLLCAELRSDETNALLASLARPLSVRAARTTFAMPRARRVVALRSGVRVTAAGYTEARRWIFGSLLAPGRHCGEEIETSILNAPHGFYAQPGRFRRSLILRPDRYGTWSLCVSAWRTSVDDPPALAFASVAVRVTRRCTRASRRVGRARAIARGACG